MQRLTIFTFAVSTFCTAVAQAEVNRVQPLTWNVFLSDWHLLGPFPKENQSDTGLDTKFVVNEAALRSGRVAFTKSKLLTWKPADEKVVNFKNVLGLRNAEREHAVAYAWTQVHSPIAQKARLAVAYDDMMMAWVNGKQVCRGEDNSASSLDQEIAEVELKQGVNTVLLKVCNGVQSWDVAARFLPAGVEKPLVRFQCRPNGWFDRLPTVNVTLLDAKKQVISSHQCNGHRGEYLSGVGRRNKFHLYAPLPDPAPAYVRYHFQAEGLKDVTRTLPFERAASVNVVLRLQPAEPKEFLVVDFATGKPVVGAQTWLRDRLLEGVSNEKGLASVEDLSPTAGNCFVVAKGFEAKWTKLSWPPAGLQRVELNAGGKSVSGVVQGSEGRPLAGAKVTLGSFNGYEPFALTDDEGRFEIIGLPNSTTRAYPVITHPGFISKDGFRLALSGTTTVANWELEPGATIAGRVTHKETGEPIADVTLVVGQDRFGSNRDKHTVTTDEDGRYEMTGVKPGGVLLHAFSDNHAPAMQSATASLAKPATVDFQIIEGKPVMGEILDPDGKPVSGVRLIVDTWNNARMFSRETRTDTEGKFTLAHMPDTQAEVHVLKQGYISQRDFMVKGGETKSLTLRPTITHTITVRDAADKIIPNVQISKGYLWSGNRDYSWQSSAWETERYYDKLQGVMKLEISEENSTYDIAYRFRATGFTESIVKLPRDATKGKEFQVVLKAAEAFEGQVVDAETGKPMPGLTVAMISREDRLRSNYVEYMTPWNVVTNQRGFTGGHAVTDAQGKFRLSKPTSKSPHSIAILSSEGGFHVVDGIDETLRSEDRNDKLLELPFPKPATLSGRLTVGGKPIANAKMHVQWTSHGDSTSVNWDYSFGAGGQVSTDAEGRFQFPPLGPGKYVLQRVFHIELAGGVSTSRYFDRREFVLLPGEAKVVDHSRSGGITFKGMTVDNEGKPLGQCVVTLQKSGERRGDSIAAARSNDQGRFQFEHLEPGAYQLQAEHYPNTEQYYNSDYVGTQTVKVTAAQGEVKVALSPVNRNGIPAAAVVQYQGTLAPEFSITLPGGEQPFTLSEHYGKVAVVCFWATWDGAMRPLNQLHEDFKDDDDTQVIFVCVQDRAALEDNLKATKTKLTFPTLAHGEAGVAELMARFGVNSPSGIVIGRDGRFASERLSTSQLIPFIKAAQAKQLAEKLQSDSASRLSITLSADDGDRGVPGARLALKAIDGEGQTVQEDKFTMPSAVRQVDWRYPALGKGGRLEVALSGRGIEAQAKTISDPSTAEKLGLNVNSPRKITGRLLMVNGEKPIADHEVRLESSVAGIVTAKTDAEGRFTFKAMPGGYTVRIRGTNELAVPESTRNVTVLADEDPAALEFKASPAVTIRGVVIGADGKPAADATVSAPERETTVTTDAKGQFELSGIASEGETRLWGSVAEAYGMVTLKDPDPKHEVRIVIGEGVNQATSVAGPSVGSNAPSFDAVHLDGSVSPWKPGGDTDRLLVFCKLWHPQADEFIKKARKQASTIKAELQIVSLDWSLDQAKRHAKSLDIKEPVLFVGPGGLSLDAWWQHGGRKAFHINREGKLASVPSDLKSVSLQKLIPRAIDSFRRILGK